MINQTAAANDAERAIVGAMLIDGRCIGDVLTAVREDDFLTEGMRAVFAAIRDLFLAGRPADPVTVVDRVGVGLKPVLLGCMDETPTAANVLDYCRILREQARLYRLREAAEAAAEADGLAEAQEILSRALADAGEKPGVRIASLAEMLSGFFRRMTAPEPPYISWGLPMLDSTLSVAGGKYVLLGARPSTGKTALALQLGLHVARSKRVGFVSLETDEATAADRIAAQHMDAKLPSIQRRKLSDADLHVLAGQAARLTGETPSFDFISGSAMTVADIRSLALARRYDVVMIDYVQLIMPAGGREDRTQAMQAVSMELRAMAQLTGVTVIALAQLRRPETGSKPRAPTMADLKESGQFEQDADVVMLLYLDDADNRFSDRWLKIEKNKEGQAGQRCRLMFEGSKQRFVYRAPEDELQETKLEPVSEQLEIPFEEDGHADRR